MIVSTPVKLEIKTLVHELTNSEKIEQLDTELADLLTQGWKIQHEQIVIDSHPDAYGLHRVIRLSRFVEA